MITTIAAIAATPRIAAGNAYWRLTSGRAYILYSTMKPFAFALITAFLLLPTAGCGGGSSTSSPVPGGKTVKMTEYEFQPNRLTVTRGTRIAVENDGQIAHNLTVENGPNPRRQSKELAGTSTFLPGRSEELKLDLEPGTYVIACTVPGHRELGMVGSLTVK
jgi:plastocyanin